MMPEMLEILVPEHPGWKKFIKDLENEIDKLGCDSMTLMHSRKILKAVPNIDVEATLNYFQSNGAYCDCEVILNIDLASKMRSKHKPFGGKPLDGY